MAAVVACPVESTELTAAGGGALTAVSTWLPRRLTESWVLLARLEMAYVCFIRLSKFAALSRLIRWISSFSCATRSGTVTPLEGPGLGVEVDEAYLRAHPLTEGPAWH